jgi:hypothetical protein
MSFVEKLDAESLRVFNEKAKQPFSEQAQFLLNAFYNELQSEMECIYHVLWEVIKKVDMDNKAIQYVHLYPEGNDLDFDMALHLFEKTLYFFNDKKNIKWKESNPRSIPKEATAIVRKKEIRERVDVNFDGRISFLEFLLYIYDLSPKDLMDRSKGNGDEPEEVRKARLALADVQKKINEYEAYKTRLEEESKLPGVKGLKAKNELAQLFASPLAEELRRLLITAEAAVRIAMKKYGAGTPGSGGQAAPTAGTVWWLGYDLQEKKKRYGPQAK